MAAYEYNLGTYSRKVTCANKQCQEWFDRGLVWAFGFHHVRTLVTAIAPASLFDQNRLRTPRQVVWRSLHARCPMRWLHVTQEEAIACFQRALEADPTCAMAHWGIAYSHGPNYNFHASNGYYVVSQQETGFPSMKLAFESVQTAATLTANVTPVEKDLIEALQLLYCWPVSTYADQLGVAYSNAMRAVHEKYSDDADVAFLCTFPSRVVQRLAFTLTRRCSRTWSTVADSMMTLHPWKLWNLESGSSVALVPELQALLAAGLERTGDHPGLCHLWIHLLEMSPTPELALPVCDRLRALSPDNPHLCHMPSHIDVLVGHYTDAIAANAKAIEADRKLVANNQIGAFFAGYAAHDYHMLVFAAMYAGQYSAAKDTAVAMVDAHASDALLRSLPPPVVKFQEGFVGVLLHVYIRFGRWDEIADYPMPEDKELYAATVATLHYARAIMHGVKGELAAARAEQQEFEQARASPFMAERVIHNNGLPAIMAVAAESEWCMTRFSLQANPRCTILCRCGLIV